LFHRDSKRKSTAFEAESKRNIAWENRRENDAGFGTKLFKLVECDGLTAKAESRSELQELLDKQDAGGELAAEEKREAEGLVELADLLSLLRLRAERSNGSPA
jgi:DNA invertase Pin-like site-specific DNA recombinase